MLQAAEENVAEQQQVLKEMSARGDELKESLQTLLPGKPVDSVSTELAVVHDSWQLTADVSDFYQQHSINHISSHDIGIHLSSMSSQHGFFGTALRPDLL